MTDSGSNGKKGKGFAGLDSMVSDVSEDVEKAAKSPPPQAPPPQPPQAGPPPQPARPEPRAAPAESSSSGSGKSGLGWVIVGVIVLVIWIANSGSGNKSQPGPSYSPPPSYSAPAPAAAPAPVPAPVAPVSDDQKPPEGRNNVLNIPQIRWCKRENIRIEAIESVINNAYDHEVDRFNARVSDYNSRCGEFLYRRGNVEQVDRELASERAAIASKAKSEWVRGSLGLNDPPKQSLRNKPNTESTASKPKQSVSKKAGTSPECQDDKECIGALFCIRGNCRTQVGIGELCKRDIDCGPLGSVCLSERCVSKDSKEPKTPVAAKPIPLESKNDSLSNDEKASIENSCGFHKTTNGPGAYNNCVAEKIRALKNSATPNLSSLSYDEKASIENSCGFHKTTNGPGAYNNCVAEKIRQLRR